MTPSQLERLRRRLSFELQHHVNAYHWARTDLERGIAAENARATRERLFDCMSALSDLRWAALTVERREAIAAGRRYTRYEHPMEIR